MGVNGLYTTLLEPWLEDCHVSRFKERAVAIDGYNWLHMGAHSCAQQLVQGNYTVRYIRVVMDLIDKLIQWKVKPVVVLDGRDLPSKFGKNAKRRKFKEIMKVRALKLLGKGKEKQAEYYFRKSLQITQEMVTKFIRALRLKKIDYVIAPYEADAQMAYLARQGMVDCVITNDSDLVLFGCPKVLFDMDERGMGKLCKAENIPESLGVSRQKFSLEEFRWMCILAGCDYSEELPVIGMKRTGILIREGCHADILSMIYQILCVLEEFGIEITAKYVEGIVQAENTFLYQLVFDTRQRKVVPLTPYPDTIAPQDVPYAGNYETDEIYYGIAVGNLDKDTLQVVDNLTDPMQDGYGHSSIWYTGDLSGSASSSGEITAQLENVSLSA